MKKSTSKTKFSLNGSTSFALVKILYDTIDFVEALQPENWWITWTFLFCWGEILLFPLHVELPLQRSEKSIPVANHQLLGHISFNFWSFILPCICDLEHKVLPLVEVWFVGS